MSKKVEAALRRAKGGKVADHQRKSGTGWGELENRDKDDFSMSDPFREILRRVRETYIDPLIYGSSASARGQNVTTVPKSSQRSEVMATPATVRMPLPSEEIEAGHYVPMPERRPMEAQLSNEGLPDLVRLALARAGGYADGGAVYDEHDFSDQDPIMQLKQEKLMQQAAGPNLTEEQKAANFEKTLRSSPLAIGLGLRDYYNAAVERNEARSRDDQGGEEAAGQRMLQGFASAAVPWRAAGRAAPVQGASSRMGTFVPVGEETELLARELAQKLRAGDTSGSELFKGMKKVFGTGNRFFGSEGRLKEEIPDNNMRIAYKDLRPDETRPMGSIVEHPQLFERHPELRDIPVTLGKPTSSPRTATDGLTGGVILNPKNYPKPGQSGPSIGADKDYWWKSNLAKTMQYELQKTQEFASSGKHDPFGVMRQIEGTIGRVKRGMERGTVNVEAGRRYLDHLRGSAEKVQNIISSGFKDPMQFDSLAARKFNFGKEPTHKDITRAVSEAINPQVAGNAEILALKKRLRDPSQTFGLTNKITLPQKEGGLNEFILNWDRYRNFGNPSSGYAKGGRVAKALEGIRRRKFAAGGLAGDTAGRSDEVPVTVGNGSYVIPADIVSALGEGNSQAGMKVLEQQFGSPARRSPKSSGVNIIVSHGEFIIPPEKVAEFGGGSVDQGHNILDQFVKLTRARNIEQLQNMPEPNQ